MFVSVMFLLFVFVTAFCYFFSSFLFVFVTAFCHHHVTFFTVFVFVTLYLFLQQPSVCFLLHFASLPCIVPHCVCFVATFSLLFSSQFASLPCLCLLHCVCVCYTVFVFVTLYLLHCVCVCYSFLSLPCNVLHCTSASHQYHGHLRMEVAISISCQYLCYIFSTSTYNVQISLFISFHSTME